MTELEKANRVAAEAFRVLRRATGLDWKELIENRVEHGFRSVTCKECGGLGNIETYDRWAMDTWSEPCRECHGSGAKIVPEESEER
jgi:hypothetical protein